MPFKDGLRQEGEAHTNLRTAAAGRRVAHEPKDGRSRTASRRKAGGRKAFASQNTNSRPSNYRAAGYRRITDTYAESSSPRSELAYIRISYRAPNARSKAENWRGNLMRFWLLQKNSGRESLRTRPRATQQRRTATIWPLGVFPSTLSLSLSLSCSGNAVYRGFLTLATTVSDCMKLAPRIFKECLQNPFNSPRPVPETDSVSLKQKKY